MLFNNEEFSGKDLIIGATYRTKQNEEWIYIGRFDYWDSEYISYDSYDKKWTKKGKKYYFYKANSTYKYFETIKSLKGKLIEIINSNCIENYAEIFDLLEKNSNYSPVDDSKDVITQYTLTEFLQKEKKIREDYWGITFHDKYGSSYEIKYDKENDTYYELKPRNRNDWYSREQKINCTLEGFYNKVQPVHLDKYLQNGKHYERKY